MTTVRVARPSELPALLEVTGDEQRNTATREYLAALLAKDCTRPQWCLVAESEGRLVASAVLWALPGGQVPSNIVLLDAPWDDSELTVGADLLGSTFDL